MPCYVTVDEYKQYFNGRPPPIHIDRFSAGLRGSCESCTLCGLGTNGLPCTPGKAVYKMIGSPICPASGVYSPPVPIDPTAVISHEPVSMPILMSADVAQQVQELPLWKRERVISQVQRVAEAKGLPVTEEDVEVSVAKQAEKKSALPLVAALIGGVMMFKGG